VLVTRGDAQAHEDPPVDAAEFLGVVKAVCRAGTSRPLGSEQSKLARGRRLGSSAFAARTLAAESIECATPDAGGAGHAADEGRCRATAELRLSGAPFQGSRRTPGFRSVLSRFAGRAVRTALSFWLR
jgi:hypothetical protein